MLSVRNWLSGQCRVARFGFCGWHELLPRYAFASIIVRLARFAQAVSGLWTQTQFSGVLWITSPYRIRRRSSPQTRTSPLPCVIQSWEMQSRYRHGMTKRYDEGKFDSADTQ